MSRFERLKETASNNLIKAKSAMGIDTNHPNDIPPSASDPDDEDDDDNQSTTSSQLQRLREISTKNFNKAKTKISNVIDLERNNRSIDSTNNSNSDSSQFQRLKESASGGLDKVRGAMGIERGDSISSSIGGGSEGDSSSDVLNELSDQCPKLTYQQRVVGFVISFGVGYLITFTSFSLFVRLMEGDPLPFVFMYTLGNVLSLLACMFLCGPKRQFKNMFDNKRKVTSIIYLSTLFITIIVCFAPFDHRIKLFVLILLLMVQFVACVWYSLSYIPFGRRTAKKLLKRVLGLDGDGM